MQNVVSKFSIWISNSLLPFSRKTYGGNVEENSKFSRCSATVLHLLNQHSGYKVSLPYCLIFDRFFTTVAFLSQLKSRGCDCEGTTRSNKTEKRCCPQLTANKWMKRNAANSMKANASHNRADVTPKCWKDSSVFTAALTLFSAHT